MQNTNILSKLKLYKIMDQLLNNFTDLSNIAPKHTEDAELDIFDVPFLS